MLGMSVPLELYANPKDIAINTVLLFSKEAPDFATKLLKPISGCSSCGAQMIAEEALIQQVAAVDPGCVYRSFGKAALASPSNSRPRASERRVGSRLSDEGISQPMQAAETEFLVAYNADVVALTKVTGLETQSLPKSCSTSHLNFSSGAANLMVRAPFEASLKHLPCLSTA